MNISLLQEAAGYLSLRLPQVPQVGIILGSGLGSLVDHLQDRQVFAYADIPHFPLSTVEGHKGELIFGFLGSISVLAMNGRFHYYEGYSMETVVFPVRVMKLLGIERVLVTNAAGGLNPDFEPGDLMLIEDVISLLPDNPLRGKNDDSLGDRFPDMSEPFDRKWQDSCFACAAGLGMKLRKGVYIGVQGPKLESKAEIRYMRIIGGDAVGMSTVPEVIAAHHVGMKVLAISVITNESIPKDQRIFTHVEVVSVAKQAGERLVALVKGLLGA